MKKKERERGAADGRCVICHSWVCLATPRTNSRFTLALVLHCSTTLSNTYKGFGLGFG